MKILFIDDRRSEIEKLISQSGIGQNHRVRLHMFHNIKACLSETLQFAPDIIFIGHGLSAFPVTGSEVIRYLRSTGVQAKIIANSGGGQVLFENDGVAVDGSVNRNPNKIAEMCMA